MLAPLFFALGLANNVFLILVFVLRRTRLDLIQRFGWLYLALAAPTMFLLVLARQESGPVEYTIFLAIFLAFLAVEGLYDWVLQFPFRESMDWRLLAPYVALYVSSSYGFVVMVWKFYSVPAGIAMLVLTIAQVLANVLTHPGVRAGDGAGLLGRFGRSRKPGTPEGPGKPANPLRSGNPSRSGRAGNAARPGRSGRPGPGR